jgi:hypothetical protein
VSVFGRLVTQSLLKRQWWQASGNSALGIAGLLNTVAEGPQPLSNGRN